MAYQSDYFKQPQRDENDCEQHLGGARRSRRLGPAQFQPLIPMRSAKYAPQEVNVYVCMSIGAQIYIKVCDKLAMLLELLRSWWEVCRE